VPQDPNDEPASVLLERIRAEPDAASPKPRGRKWRAVRLGVVTLAGELDELGVKPMDLKFLAVSHTHPYHIGNVEFFPQTMLLVQYEWPSPRPPDERGDPSNSAHCKALRLPQSRAYKPHLQRSSHRRRSLERR
jgi:glyoxylase-like metal-dependent hydrolase (beta-lactamase superfamily II)